MLHVIRKEISERAWILETADGTVTSFMVIHDRLGVSELLKLFLAEMLRRLVNGFALEVLEFGYKVPDKVATWIRLFALEDGIEDSEVRLRINPS